MGIALKNLTKVLLVGAGAAYIAKGLDRRLEITNYIIENPKIPADLDNFKIVLIADLHSDIIAGLVGSIAAEKPDMILSAGDLADDEGSFEPAISFAGQIAQIAPVYAVTGNHDLWRNDYKDYAAALSNTGVVTLHNRRIIFRLNSADIALTGLDDPLAHDNGKIEENLEKEFSKLGQYNGFDILLFHRANLFDLIKDKGFDLVLSGHMHGGLMRFPNGRGIFAPKSGFGANSSAFFPKYYAGSYKSGNTEMIVSRGLGNATFLPRLYNRPELVTISLRCGNK